VTGIRVRPFKPEDNRALIEVARQMGVPARVSLGVDRSPCFIAASHALYGESESLVAEENGAPVGFMDVGYVTCRCEGRPIRVAYVELAGIRADRRGSAAFVLLAQEAERVARAAGARLGVALVNANNRRPARAVELRYQRMVWAEPIAIACIVPWSLRGPDRRYRYRPAEPDDAHVIAGLIQRHRSGSFLSQVVEPGKFGCNAETGDRRVLVAEDRTGRLVASLGLWDQSEFRRARVLSLDRLTTAAACGLRILGRFVGIPPLPSTGENLRVIYGTCIACETEHASALGGLIRLALADLRRSRHHFLLLGIPEHDTCCRALSGLLRVTNVNVPALMPLDQGMVEMLTRLHAPRVWLEYALT
jgi:hypothetical protein